MEKTEEQIEPLAPLDALEEFMKAFVGVFDHDWDHAEGCLSNEMRGYFIAAGGTFVNPGLPNDQLGNNWSSRAYLLDKMHAARATLISHGRPDPLKDWLDIT